MTHEQAQARFYVSKNAMGMTTLVDGTRKGNGNKGVIALFFQDKTSPVNVDVYADLSAAALNAENARREAKKTTVAEKGTI